jgi:hypothetical protein
MVARTAGSGGKEIARARQVACHKNSLSFKLHRYRGPLALPFPGKAALLVAVFDEWEATDRNGSTPRSQSHDSTHLHFCLLRFVDEHWSPLSSSVVAIAAPVPLFGPEYQTACHRIAV